MVVIKKYLEYIKESIDNDGIIDKYYFLSEEKIKNIFQEFIDSKWSVGADVYNEKQGDIYEDLIIFLRGNELVYNVDIRSTSETESEDLTDEFKTIIDYLNDEYEIDDIVFGSVFHLKDGTIKDYKINENIYITSKRSGHTHAVSSIEFNIFNKERKKFSISPKELIEYYNWKNVEISKDGNIWALINRTDLIDYTIDDSQMKEYLLDGFPGYTDVFTAYEISNSLSYKNELKLSKKIIEEVGIENLKEHDKDVDQNSNIFDCDINMNLIDSEIIQTLRDLYTTEFEDQAFKSINDEFENKLGDYFTFKKKLDGKTIYKLKYEDEFIRELWGGGALDFIGDNLSSLLIEWFLQNARRLEIDLPDMTNISVNIDDVVEKEMLNN